MKKLMSMLCILCVLCSTACSFNGDDDETIVYEFNPNVGDNCSKSSLEGTYKVTAIGINEVKDCEFSFVNTNDYYASSYIYVKNFPDSRSSEPINQSFHVSNINVFVPIYDSKGHLEGYEINNGLVRCSGDGYVVFFDFGKHDSEGVVEYQDVHSVKYSLRCKKAPLKDEYKQY